LSNRHFVSQSAGNIKRGLALLTLALCVTAAFGSVLQAQTAGKPRKVVSDVKPSYPETLKNLHIAGVVRLTAIVLPNGNVLAIEVRGGNPILVENAIKAVKAWKYAPAASQTEEEVVLNFVGR
jgi:TonB family protein